MDERLKKRIYAFYFAGVVNAVLGLYLLIEGGSFLSRSTVLVLVLFFFGFAALDFYFPKAMKRKWLEQQKQLEESRRSQGGPS